MPQLQLNDISLHYQLEGPEDGQPLVFANSLNTRLELWDPLLAHLPEGLRILRYDMRGHGRSDVPQPPYAMGALVRDAEGLMDALEIKDAIFVGLSIGGLVGQGLAIKRRDLIRGLVLSNTAAKIGTPAMWEDRIAAVQAGGMAALTDSTMERWFSRAFREAGADAPWRKMFEATPTDGYIGCAKAISGTDFYTTTAALSMPVLAIAGSEDGSTPPDLVRETQELIKGSRFYLIRRAGHLPCVERPEEYAQVLTDFMTETGAL
jgi:3-oxoadipate enol-lactonase